jgi:hypothetical protein
MALCGFGLLLACGNAAFGAYFGASDALQGLQNIP